MYDRFPAKIISAALLMLTLSACAGAGAPPKASEIGPKPNVDVTSKVKWFMEGKLKDAQSARYRQVGGPVPGRAQEPLLAGGHTVEGWGYCYMINAKNSFGGYTGYKPYYFVFAGDALLGYAQNPQLSSWNCF